MNGTGRVLVVDDDRDTVELVVSTLADEGYTVMAADNGATALCQARRHRPGLILLDIRMPVLDGGEFLAALRRSRVQGAAVVVFTALHDGADRASRLGAEDFLPKPFELDQLLALAAKYAGIAGGVRASET